METKTKPKKTWNNGDIFLSLEETKRMSKLFKEQKGITLIQG